MRSREILRTLAASLAGLAFSVAGQSHAADGEWSVIRTDVTIRAPDGSAIGLGGICAAVVNSLDRGNSAGAERKLTLGFSGGWVLIVVFGSDWNFRSHTAAFTLRSGGQAALMNDAVWGGTSVETALPAPENPYQTIRQLAATGEPVIIFDDKGKVLAEFPASSFQQMADQAMACSGRQCQRTGAVLCC